MRRGAPGRVKRQRERPATDEDADQRANREARASLEQAIRYCESLIEKGESELQTKTTTDPNNRPLAPGTELPSSRILEAAHGGEVTLGALRLALAALDRGDLEAALAFACARLCDLTFLVDRTADGFVSSDERASGIALAARERRRQLSALWAEVHRREALADPADWSRAGSSRRSILEEIRAEAAADPQLRRNLFGKSRALPSLEAIARRLQRDAKHPRRHS